MYRKMEEIIHGSFAGIQPAFSAYGTQLTGKQSPPFARAGNSGLEAALTFYILITNFQDS